MKRAPIIEDWSRFNRSVLEVADGRAPPAARKPPAPPPPKREPPDPPNPTDPYGLVDRQTWRKHA